MNTPSPQGTPSIARSEVAHWSLARRAATRQPRAERSAALGQTMSVTTSLARAEQPHACCALAGLGRERDSYPGRRCALPWAVLFRPLRGKEPRLLLDRKSRGVIIYSVQESNPVSSPRRKLLITALPVATVTVVLLSFCIAPIASRMEWNRIERRMASSIRSLEPTHPKTIDPRAWECAHSWVQTAYINICFCPEHTSIAEMYRLQEDLDGKLTDEIDLETLRWIWDRLGNTGPHGKQYIERFRPAFRSCFQRPGAP